MESAIFLAVLLSAVGFSKWGPLRRFRSALGLDHLMATGHVYLVTGAALALVLGGLGEALDHIGPVNTFAAGWVGFAVGMRFQWRILREVPRVAHGVALAPGLAVGAMTLALAALGLRWIGTPWEQALAAGCILAAASTSSGPTLPAVTRGRRAGRGQKVRATLRMIEFSAGLDDLLVLGFAIVGLGLFQTGGHLSTGFVDIAIGVGGAAVLGGVIWLFLGGRAADDERMLLGLAMLVFLAGFGAWLELSAATLAAIGAIVLANLPGRRFELLFDSVRRMERTVVVVLMMLVGVQAIGPVHWAVVPLVLLLTVLRAGVHYVVGNVLARPDPVARGLRVHRGWALGLTPQGVLGLAVAVGFYGVSGDVIGRTVLAAVAAATVLNELAAPWLLLPLLRRLQGAPERSVAAGSPS